MAQDDAVNLECLGSANKGQVSTFAILVGAKTHVSVIPIAKFYLYENYLSMFCFRSSTP